MDSVIAHAMSYVTKGLSGSSNNTSGVLQSYASYNKAVALLEHCVSRQDDLEQFRVSDSTRIVCDNCITMVSKRLS